MLITGTRPGDQSFTAARQCLWNNLPLHLCDSELTLSDLEFCQLPKPCTCFAEDRSTQWLLILGHLINVVTCITKWTARDYLVLHVSGHTDVHRQVVPGCLVAAGSAWSSEVAHLYEVSVAEPPAVSSSHGADQHQVVHLPATASRQWAAEPAVASAQESSHHLDVVHSAATSDPTYNSPVVHRSINQQISINQSIKQTVNQKLVVSDLHRAVMAWQCIMYI